MGFIKMTLSELMDLLPVPPDFESGTIPDSDFDRINSAVPALREATGGCPACMMAALRQKGFPIPVVTAFNYTNEMKAIWDSINDSALEGSYD
jgi:hypothetical protein